MKTSVPEGFEKETRDMQKLNTKLLGFLRNYRIEKYPLIKKKTRLAGEGFAEAYPIQGVLKYHGMSDWKYRIAFFPSVSVCNNAAKTITYVKFDSDLRKDEIIVNGKKVVGNESDRVLQTLNFLRKITATQTKAIVESRNVIKAEKTGKGLGTSASASAALALAGIEAALGMEYSSNMRFVSACARFLSGSGCRSAAGGLSLWLSYPGINHEDSFAVRLDNKDQFKEIDLITVPVDSRIGLKTESAHKAAPKSPFFKPWISLREKHMMELLEAVKMKDWKKLGELAELDTILLHGTTMSGGNEKIIAWEPETIQLMRAANELRSGGIPVYYSIDTGPTTVFITHEKYTNEVLKYISSLGFTDIVKGKIAGQAKLLPDREAEALLK